MNKDGRYFDFVIVGGGIIGITVAKKLALSGRYSIAVLEKEDRIAQHASGRNSGVLHAGFYYTSDSLKARFCRDGNLGLRNYCKMRGLPIIERGKVVVARNELEVDTLYELERRGKANGVELKIIDEKELEDLEPSARTYQKALYSPNTAVVDPVKVCEALASDAKSEGVEFLLRTTLIGLKKDENLVITNNGKIRYGHLINCSGVYADKIAHLFDVGNEYRIVPFKGIYYELNGIKAQFIRSNIYPVPDLRNPFLGVHFTKNPYGKVLVGPTAMPVLDREGYERFIGRNTKEAISIVTLIAKLWLQNEGSFRSNVYSELRKYNKRWFTQKANDLVPDLSIHDFLPSTHCGIRAQLINIKKNNLVLDFIILQNANSTHILNAISPAFTCSLPFANYVVDQIKKYLGFHSHDEIRLKQGITDTISDQRKENYGGVPNL